MIPIVVPSYRRVDTFKNKTLAMLDSYSVDMNRLHVFVASLEEEKRYRTVTPGEATIVIGVPGMMNIRNYISEHFDDGQALVCLDDDIDGLYRRMNAKKYTRLERFDDMQEAGFKACDRSGARLWGIYPVLNAMFMKPRTLVGFRYIVGCVWGCYNSKHLKVTTDDKEDFERSILYYREFGSVVRVEWIAPKTAYYKEQGGMQETRTDKRVRDSAVYLVDKYPQFCSLNTAKKSGHWEVRLRDRR